MILMIFQRVAQTSHSALISALIQCRNIHHSPLSTLVSACRQGQIESLPPVLLSVRGGKSLKSRPRHPGS
ncbi:MAG: hypothetical protein A2Y79_01935 [Deltaproteobacteria bacterium RBG_13_43_22]|nr:MAG: hypothetical protein A2Y79_01935 [Deltaproteobacteria bacterium RBG_13_43_22]